jgi:hypothetical protein
MYRSGLKFEPKPKNVLIVASYPAATNVGLNLLIWKKNSFFFINYSNKFVQFHNFVLQRKLYNSNRTRLSLKKVVIKKINFKITYNYT